LKRLGCAIERAGRSDSGRAADRETRKFGLLRFRGRKKTKGANQELHLESRHLGERDFLFGKGKKLIGGEGENITPKKGKESGNTRGRALERGSRELIEIENQCSTTGKGGVRKGKGQKRRKMK